VYLPFIIPLKNLYNGCNCIDLGCGRGEWLELLKEHEIEARGVDLDVGMLEAARAGGLNVRLGDAISSLRELTAASQDVVSAFHLVEHLSFDVLRVLLSESLRVLKPGGLLILETPNPENLTVGTEKFYLDPTHNKPIPAQLLSFMLSWTGFEKVKVLRLQEPVGIENNESLALLSVLNGVSPDYAVVSQKTGAIEVEEVTRAAFEADYGLSLETLANRYDLNISRQFVHLSNIAHQAMDTAQEAKLAAHQAMDTTQEAKLALFQVHNSTSWKITSPLRKLSLLARNWFRRS